MKTASKAIGILGGTFDPVHYGHLRIALEVRQQLGLDEIRFIPCQRPVLDKTAQASVEHRLAMLELAIVDQEYFTIDKRELERNTPSYAIETLISLRQEFTKVSLCWIIGSDAFNSLERWHRWEELLNFGNFIVIHRLGTSSIQPAKIIQLLNQHQIKEPADIINQPCGKVLSLNLPSMEISSTYIRQQLSMKKDPRYLFPDSVLQYIHQHRLYS